MRDTTILIIAGILAIFYIIIFYKEYKKAKQIDRPKILTIYMGIMLLSCILFVGIKAIDIPAKMGWVQETPKLDIILQE